MFVNVYVWCSYFAFLFEPVVRRLHLCEELERSSCGSVLFHGYLPLPGIITEYLWKHLKGSQRKPFSFCLPNITFVKQSDFCSPALPARSNAGGQTAAAAGQDERSGPSGAEGGFPHSCPQSSLPGPSEAEGPQRLGEKKHFNAKTWLHWNCEACLKGCNAFLIQIKQIFVTESNYTLYNLYPLEDSGVIALLTVTCEKKL